MDEDKLSEKIPNFYYDILARIIPGCLFVGSYSYLIKEDFSEFQKSIIFLIASYLSGYILNMFSVDIWNMLFYKREIRKKWFNGKFKDYEETKVWDKIRRTINIDFREIMIKMMAEYLMIKSLTLVSFIWFLFPPKVMDNFKFDPHIIPLIIFIIFMRCLYRSNLRIIRNENVHLKP